MQTYLGLMREILARGNKREDRTGTGTVGLFAEQIKFDLQAGFPLLTTKQVPLRLIAHELIWFLKGDTNIKYLIDNKISIWTAWPLKHYNQTFHNPTYGKDLPQEDFEFMIRNHEDFAAKWGEVGPVYGKQWRNWETPSGTSIDQIDQRIKSLTKDPYSRRHLVSAWNVSDLEAMNKAGLEPCHCLFQFYVREIPYAKRIAGIHGQPDSELENYPKFYLDCRLDQRSADYFLGVPFNIASYALLVHIFANILNMVPGELTLQFGDVHLYSNHIDQAMEQLTREPRKLPVLEINRKLESVDDFKYEDITLTGYDPHPTIKAPIAV